MSGFNENLTERRAIFVYHCARIAAYAANAPIIPEPWPDREKPFKDQFLKIIEQECGPDRLGDPKTLHESWMEAYLKMGWKYGIERDTKLKTHPDLVPYWELGQLERDKDDVFVALCDIARKWVY